MRSRRGEIEEFRGGIQVDLARRANVYMKVKHGKESLCI
jgi:hypothetical protein